MIKELLQIAIFSPGAKADMRSVQEIRKMQVIPISAVILSIVAVRFCLPRSFLLLITLVD